MISGVSQSVSFARNTELGKINKQEAVANTSAKENKLEAISKRLENGEYKVDLGALASKIADDLI